MKRHNKILSRGTMPYLMLLPMIAIICIFMLYPIFNTFWLSIQEHVLTNPDAMGFNGGANFARLVQDETFWKAAVNSLYWTIVNVALQLFFGLLVALLLNQNFRMRGIFRALIFTPWAVGGILVALIWSFMFNESVGVIGDLLAKTGLISERVSWFSKGNTSMWAMNYDVVLVPPLGTIRSTTLSMLRELSGQGGKVIFTGGFPEFVDGVRRQTDDIGVFSEGKWLLVSFESKSVLDALEPYREVEILEQDGSQCRDYFYQLREDGGDRWLFLAKGRPEKEHGDPVEMHREVVVNGCFFCEFPDPVSGGMRRLSWRVRGGDTRITWNCYEQDSLLVHLLKEQDHDDVEGWDSGAEPEADPDKKIVMEKSSPFPDRYILSEPNVLLLDQPFYSLDRNEWKGPEEILRLDDNLRAGLGYTLRTESLPQPWLSPEKGKEEHLVTLRFLIQSEFGGIPVRTAVEGDPSRILWNGENVILQRDGWYVDRCYGVWNLGTLRQGENELLLEFPYGESTNLEWCYLLGSFGTKEAGRQAVLTEQPKEIYYGDITKQGFAFYGGSLTYILEGELPEGELEVEIPHYQAPLVKVVLDGTVSASVTTAPYKALLGRISKGRHEIRMVSYGNRHNTFGPLHNANAEEAYFGPKAWRTSGSSWTYGYRLKPAGILEAPVIRVKS